MSKPPVHKTTSPVATEANPLSSLLDAYQMGHNVRKNFDWPNVHDIFEKLFEEIAELQESLHQTPAEQIHELGDVLFTLVQIARHLQIDPDASLKLCNERHLQRVQMMQRLCADDGFIYDNLNLEDLGTYWQQAKVKLKPQEKAMIENYLAKKIPHS